MPPHDLEQFLSGLARWSERVADAMQPAIEAWERAAAAIQETGRSLESEPGLIDRLREIDGWASEAAAAFVQQEDAALRLSINTPLTPEQARSLIREHGLAFAERVGELVSLAWSVERAVEVVSGRDEQGYRLLSQYMDLPRTRYDTAVLQATPINPGGPLRGVVGFGPDGPYFKRSPGHGTPSSFAEVCGDEAVGRIQTACDRCAFYSPPPSCMDGKPALTCALHPLGRPEGRCGDWEDRRTEAAAMAIFAAAERAEAAHQEAIERRREAIEAASRRPEAHAYIDDAGQVMMGFEEEQSRDRHLALETVEEDWRWVRLPDGSERRFLISRTTTRHYSDGQHEIVPDEAFP